MSNVDYEKYTTALKLMDAALALSSSEGNSPPAAYEAVDALFEFIYANFAIPESALNNEGQFVATDATRAERDLAHIILGTTYPGLEFETALRSIPPVFAEVVWPIAVQRFILRDNRAHIYHSNIKSYDTFHKRYGNLVI